MDYDVDSGHEDCTLRTLDEDGRFLRDDDTRDGEPHGCIDRADDDAGRPIRLAEDMDGDGVEDFVATSADEA